MYTFLLRFVRTIGNALLYGVIFTFLVGSTAYAIA
jgi:hypothetical protein